MPNKIHAHSMELLGPLAPEMWLAGLYASSQVSMPCVYAPLGTGMRPNTLVIPVPSGQLR